MLAENKKALFDYHILEKFQAGIMLKGQEVKSIKLGRMNLKGSFVLVRGGEVFLLGASIPPYQPNNLREEYNPTRTRKLLLRKKEIRHLEGFSGQKSLTMVPLSVYNDQHNNLKIEFAITKGKKEFDKREVIKKREAEREIGRVLKR